MNTLAIVIAALSGFALGVICTGAVVYFAYRLLRDSN